MDPVHEIKARLPIEALVGQYCQLTKKGRNFVTLCPFHNDKKPSMTVSPDKGIAYCFPCQKGGDIFSFYQQIEGVDFIQALKDLAEQTGITLPDRREAAPAHSRDEKEQARACLEAALAAYRKGLAASQKATDYLAKRGVTPQEIELFELGYAADGNVLYDTLLKGGFSRAEILLSGLAIQRDLAESKPFDRFRDRLMFAIRDHQGRVVGFGGRTLGNDDAKYMNSPDSPLYHKSAVLFGLPQARDEMRTSKRAYLVEGYFDVLACHRVGIKSAIAACGTALTEEHARFLRRHVETVVLCMDQDRAGRDAAERAYAMLSKEGVAVRGIVLPDKDPADAVQTDPEGLRALLESAGEPYVDLVLTDIRRANLDDQQIRRAALQRILGLLSVVPTAVERAHYLEQAASALRTSTVALEDDLQSLKAQQPVAARPAPQMAERSDIFSALEFALGLFLIHGRCRSLLPELIPPEDAPHAAVYAALQSAGEAPLDIAQLPLEEPARERLRILQLYCEEQGFAEWSESTATREIRRNCLNANREYLHRKQKEITKRLVDAKRAGSAEEEGKLQAQFTELLKLAKMAN
jgi:DNA primase